MLWLSALVAFALLVLAYVPYARAMRRYLRATAEAGDPRAEDQRIAPSFGLGSEVGLLRVLRARTSLTWTYSDDANLESLRRSVVRRQLLFYASFPVCMVLGTVIALLIGALVKRLPSNAIPTVDVGTVWGVAFVALMILACVREFARRALIRGAMFLAAAVIGVAALLILVSNAG